VIERFGQKLIERFGQNDQDQEKTTMLTRAAFGLAIVLATVSGSLAAQRGHAIVDTQTVYNPSGAYTAGPRPNSDVACWQAVWGFSCTQ
jgi:hypothetical protein